MTDVKLEDLPKEDREFYEKYGRLPPKAKKTALTHQLKGKERKIFDSADYYRQKEKQEGQE